MDVKHWTPMLRHARKALTAASLALLAACGGGGDGGGGGGTLPPLIYSGNTNAAVVSTSNASGLVSGILGSSNTADVVAGVSAAGPAEMRTFDGGQIGRGRQLGKSARDLLRQSMRAASGARTLSAAQIDETEMCMGGGSVRVFGTLNDNTGTGTLTVQYINCTENGETINGQGSFRIDFFDFGMFAPTDFTLFFPRLEFRATGISRDVGGSVRVQLVGLTETLTQNLVTLDNLTGGMTRSENFFAVTIYDNLFNPTSITTTLTGRYFDSAHGFVDVTTSTPLNSTSLNELFPRSGQITLMGDSGRAVRATAVSTSVVMLALDLDGNGTFERNVTLAWLELSSISGADLADDDNDGMHNGWEDAKGLDRTNNADGALDPDADGFTSQQEYQAGTHPNDATSFPLTGPGPGSGSDPTPIAFSGVEVALAGVSDVVYDTVSQKLYATVRAGAGNAGSVVPIDPMTGAVGTAIAVGKQPTKLALSDNGQYLYVGFDGESSVHRIDLTLATPAVDLTIPLGNGTLSANFAEDIAVLPGNPQSIAVSLKNSGFSPRHEGVAIFDNAVQRATKTPGHTGSNVIEFSASSDTLYGYNNETTGFGFYRLALSASGVAVSDVHDSFNPAGALIEGFGVDIRFHAGRVYTTSGRVIDPVDRTILGTFVLPATFGNAVSPDVSVGRVYFLTNSGGLTIRAYSETSVQPPVAIMSLPAMSFPGTARSLVRCGANCLAYVTFDPDGLGGKVIVAQSATLVP